MAAFVRVWLVAFAMSLRVHGAAFIAAQPVPDPGTPGFRFPEGEANITGWISAMSRGGAADASQAGFERVHAHAWGLWAALTTRSNQTYEGERLRVFETWTTPEELSEQPPGQMALAPLPRRRASLRRFKRFTSAEAGFVPLAPANAGAAGRVVGFIKFDPTAAGHILKQRLLSAAALNSLLSGGAQQVPPFPSTALAVKAVYQVVRTSDLVDGRYYRLPTWQGPPDVAQAWGPDKWSGCVWIDTMGGGAGRGQIDPVAAEDGSSRTDGTTYPLSTLIAITLSADEASALDTAEPSAGAAAGDRAILIAMHVAGRETARWTWQTFWWTPDPDTPPAPSSAAIAAVRPAQLGGAPRHYAMALAYTLLTPDQPYVAGDNSAPAVYAYNPWLEAQFGPDDLPDSMPGLDPAGQPAANNCGVQSNCMSCHLRANYHPKGLATAPGYAGAGYVDLTDPRFVGTLQTDLLWSVAAQAK